MASDAAIDPRTGSRAGEPVPHTEAAEVAAAAAAAAEAFPALERAGRAGRARLLWAIGDRLDERRDELVATADAETGLGGVRLRGEVGRSSGQARFFAEVLEEGSYLEAAIDTAVPAGDTTPGAPDLRRMLVPLGPVAVFGASNFPLAFSVPGGDTVSALAAGCPVVVKAHESHPGTSRAAFAALRDAVADAGLPEAAVGIVHGRDAGTALVEDQHITAVGFTGSTAGGRALMEAAAARPTPIPFYGELAGINPVVVTAGAARENAGAIADGALASVTGSGGQLCTKPGLLFVPAGAEGDALVERMSAGFAGAAQWPLLNGGIRAAFGRAVERLAGEPGVTLLAEGKPDAKAGAEGSDGGFWAKPRLLSVAAGDLSPSVAEECFGPLTVVARYRDGAELAAALGALPPSLSTTLHATDAEAAAGEQADVLEVLRATSGRIVFGGFPTGVRVSWAQTHGGPWPSTTNLHTSVGATAIRRFLRPVTWQSAPAAVLPAELRDGPVDIPRRVDGRLVLPGS